ncbi:MAG: asparagine synthase (glutamine-hydrolyzing) [Lachnospiraceae bacterium]|nr:asparagine synthase (glutamine-hydrolyzing) [Lachnospiraceae bacterium]
MCGIAGLIGYGRGSAENLEKMKERMVHRGPDGEGSWHSEDETVWFGHRRLAIIDLSPTGVQPMTSKSGRMTIAYNGEIYNYRALKEALAEKGVKQFRGTSDTEVLLEAIECFGIEKTLEMSKGMFAFAVYDRQDGTVTLARDRVGEKPLYYGFVRGAFAFSSDIGSLAVLDRFDNKIRKDILPIYLSHGYIPAPYTVYENIWKLEPGKILKVKAPYTEKDLEERTYWSMKETALRGQNNLFRGSFEEASRELERLLRASIRDQVLSSDVPVGAFLSAGIDSSTVVSLMQAENPGTVRSFTIGMEDPAYNEAVYAKEIAAHLGTQHTELYITEEDCKGVIPLLPRMFGEPFADSSQIPTYLVSRMTRDHVTVSLSGDAGDELFCGYNSYESVERIWGKLKKLPYPLRLIGGSVWESLPLPRRSYGKLVKSASPEELYRLSRERDPLMLRLPVDKTQIPYTYTQIGRDNFHEPNHDIMLMDLMMYHPDDILVKVDRTAMAVSLETRVPLLDRDVVEFAWTLPLSYVRGDAGGQRIGKRILKDVLYRHVPREMMERPKKGFSIPIMKWLKEKELRAWAEGLLAPEKLRAQGLFDADAVSQMWREFIEQDHWRIQIWFLLMFEAWYESEYRKSAA